MAPLAFTFNKIKIYIYYEDHLPIHIHAIYNEFETVYILHFDKGKLSIEKESSNNPLPKQQDRLVVKFLKKYYLEVIKKWEQVVVLKKEIKVKRITGL